MYVFSFACDGGVVGKGISQLIEYCVSTWQGKAMKINFVGQASSLGSSDYNKTLGKDRGRVIAEWFRKEMIRCEEAIPDGFEPQLESANGTKISLYPESHSFYGLPKGKSGSNQRYNFVNESAILYNLIEL